MTRLLPCPLFVAIVLMIMPIGAASAEPASSPAALGVREIKRLPGFDLLITASGRAEGLAPLITSAFAAYARADYAAAGEDFARARKALITHIRARDDAVMFGLTTAGDIHSLDPAYTGEGPHQGGPTNGRREEALLLYMQALSEWGSSNTKSAQRSLRRALGRNKQFYQARADLAWVLALNGEEKEARRHLAKLDAMVTDCRGDCGIDAGLAARIARAEAAIDAEFSGWAPYRLD